MLLQAINADTSIAAVCVSGVRMFSEIPLRAVAASMLICMLSDIIITTTLCRWGMFGVL